MLRNEIILNMFFGCTKVKVKINTDNRKISKYLEIKLRLGIGRKQILHVTNIKPTVYFNKNNENSLFSA